MEKVEKAEKAEKERMKERLRMQSLRVQEAKTRENVDLIVKSVGITLAALMGVAIIGAWCNCVVRTRCVN